MINDNVLITGSNGFIGFNVTDFISNKNINVIGIGRSKPRSNLEYKSNVQIKLRKYENFFSNQDKFNYVIHCASEIPHYCDNETIYKKNIDLTHQLIDHLTLKKPKVLIYLSSMSAYGKIDMEIVDEEKIPYKLDEYGRSKLDSEKLIKKNLSRVIPSIICIRLPGVVGKGSHNNFLSNVVDNIKKNNEVVASNPRALFNNIIHINKLSEFIFFLLIEKIKGFHVTNVGAVEPITIDKVLKIIFSKLDQEEKTRYIASKNKPFLISLKKAEQLGFSPETVTKSINNYLNEII